MTVDKRLLREREKIKKSRPKFRRQESWRYKRIKKSWRKPIGIDNSMRHHKRGIPTIVRTGFRGPKAVRGLTRAGMEEVLIHNLKELEAIDNKTQVARIGSSVGTRKKVAITNRADELSIKILNRPEEALTFATISEISEELMLEDDDKKDKKSGGDSKPAPRKKKSSKDLTAEELEELARIEAEISGKKAAPKKKATTAKKTTPTKSTSKASGKPTVVVEKEIVVTFNEKTYKFDKGISMTDLKAKRAPNAVKDAVAEVRGWKSWKKLS